MAAPKMAMAVAQPVATVPVAKSAAPAPKAAVAVAAAPAGKGSAAPVAGAVAAPSSAASSADAEGDVDAKLYETTNTQRLRSAFIVGEHFSLTIMDCPVTRIYLLTNGSKKLVEAGTMQVLMVDPDGVKGTEDDVYLLLSGGFKLALRMYVPCLEMAPRNFVFPTDDKTYGIIIADTITDDVLDVFRVMLQEHTSFRTAETAQNIEALPDTVEKVTSVANSVAAGLGAGSVVVATGVIKGGKLVGSLVMKGGSYLTSKLNRNKEATKVSDEHKARLQKAKFVSGAAVKVSKALVIGAMATTQVMAHQLSEAIKETEIGKKIAAEPEVPNANLEAAKVVGKATIGAVLNVYQAMETAVFGVAHDVSAATVTVVTHKYGEEAGHHTKESLGVVENVAVAAHGMKQLGVKSIAKATAIKTGQEVLTTDAERAEEAQKKADALAAAGPAGQMRAGLGAAMGLPEGIDPMLAMEAMQSVAVLKAAAAGMGPGHQGDTLTTATATGPTPAAAQAAASAAAHAAAPHQ